LKKLNKISRGETFGDEGGCFLKQNGKIHEGPDFMPRENTVISQKHMTVLTLDGEDYIRIFHPGLLFERRKNILLTKIRLEAKKRFTKKLTPNCKYKNAQSKKIVIYNDSLINPDCIFDIQLATY